MVGGTSQRMAAAFVAGLLVLPAPSWLGGATVHPAGTTAAASDVPDGLGGLLVPGPSATALEDAAVALADELRAVPADGSGTACATDDLRVLWEPPVGYGDGTYLEPLGPRPDLFTTDVNGVVVCQGSRQGFLGFEAHRHGSGWRLYPVATAEASAEANDPPERPTPGSARVRLAALSGAELGPVDPYAAYDPQTTCDPTVKPGTAALTTLLLDAVPGTAHLGLTRRCDRGPTSEHKEGRAFDWGVPTGGARAVEAALARVLATDADGNPHALARRMGVMYIIFDGRIWSSYRPDDGWRRFTGPDDHDDHVHISLSWDGALGRTSLWQAGLDAGWWELPMPAPPVDQAPASGGAPVVVAQSSPPAGAGVPPDDGAPAETPTPAGPADPPAPSPSPAPSPIASPRPQRPVPSDPPDDQTPRGEPTPDATPSETAPTPSESEPTPTPTPPDPEPAPEERVLVRFDGSVAEQGRAVVRDELDVVLVHASGSVDGLEVWAVAAGRTGEVLAATRQRSDVVHAEADATVVATSSPAESLADATWALTGPGGIDAPTAWAVTTGSRDVTVAVLDSGMDLDHVALAANLWTNPGEVAGNGVDDDGNGRVDDVHGWDFCADDAVPDDDHGQGTHVAGTIGAVGDATGVVGVAPLVTLAPLKVLCADGTGRVSDVVAALDHVLAAGVPISVLGWPLSGTPSPALAGVVAAAEEVGHLLVAPAGDLGDDGEATPVPAGVASSGAVVTVGATAIGGVPWPGSRWDAASVDLGAPGVAILSTSAGGGVAGRSGTVHAAAHVAGTAALLRAVHPEWTASELRDRLLATVATEPVLEGRVVTGGILDAGAALVAGRPADDPVGLSPVGTRSRGRAGRARRRRVTGPRSPRGARRAPGAGRDRWSPGS